MLYRSAKGGSCLFAGPRIGSIWTHQNSPFYQRLRQRKNKQGAEAHVFMLAWAGEFSTTIDWNEHPSVGCRVGVHCITQALWRICDTFSALSRENFNAASAMLQTRLKPNQNTSKRSVTYHEKENDFELCTGTGIDGIGHRHGNLRLCRHIRTNGACY